MVDYWKEASDITLTGAALLSLGKDPSLFDAWLESVGEPLSPDDVKHWPYGFHNRLAALVSAVRAGVMPTIKLVQDQFGNPSPDTLVLISDVKAWCRDKGIQLDQTEPPDQPGRWPWGDYETDALRWMARTYKEFWSTYDPDDSTTIPNAEKEIIPWLVDQGVSKNVAAAIDKVLRADNLPKGPRTIKV